MLNLVLGSDSKGLVSLDQFHKFGCSCWTCFSPKTLRVTEDMCSELLNKIWDTHS